MGVHSDRGLRFHWLNTMIHASRLKPTNCAQSNVAQMSAMPSKLQKKKGYTKMFMGSFHGMNVHVRLHVFGEQMYETPALHIDDYLYLGLTP